MIGTTLSHYRVLDRLGEGGMGEVYLVEDLKLHRKAALKLIAPHLTANTEQRQRFVQEATLAASIDHPHIAAIYDIDQADGRTFIVMEYVQGQSLREILKPGPISPGRAIDLAAQIADALAKVHERGVVHRDLKPENVIVAAEGYAKVIDFGVAKLADPLKQAGLVDAATMTDVQVRTSDGFVLGTMAYMSPEQVRGETVDARSDIFSFGALLQEMLTGTPPFRRRSAAETLSAILTLPPPPVQLNLGGAESDLQRVIRKCLVKEAAGRYQSMRDVVVDLREARDSIASGATAVSGGASGSRARTRRVWRQVAAAVAVVAAIAAAALVMWRRDAAVPLGPSGGDPRPSLAVLAFDVVSAGSDVAWLAKGLPSMLMTGLTQTPDVEIVGPERLNDAARQFGAANLDAIERTQLTELARRAGARFVVTGTIAQAGTELRIDARVEDLRSGAVRLAQSVRGKDPFALADDLAARIRSGFNVSPTSEVRRVADVASSSIDAYRAYTSGLEAWNNARFDDARALLTKAVTLDPEFGMAHYVLAQIENMFGFEAEQRKHLTHAAAHLERLPDRESMLVRAELAHVDGRLDEAETLLEAVITRYRDTEAAYQSLGLFFLPMMGPRPNAEKAVGVFQRGVMALPYSAVLRAMLGYAHIQAGQFDDAIREMELYVKLRPSESNGLDSLAEANLVAGNLSEALETYDRAVAAGHGREGRAWTLAVLGRLKDALADLPEPGVQRWAVLSRLGRYRQAETEIAQSLARGPENPERRAHYTLLEALFDLERGRYDAASAKIGAARRLLQRASALRRRQWVIIADLLAGLADVRTGRLERAREALADARQLHAPLAAHERWWVQLLEGEIALGAGDPSATSRSFSAGEPPKKMVFLSSSVVALSFFANNLVARDLRARAAAASGRPDEAIALYRALLTPGRAQKWTAMLDPRHVLALARLLDKAGQRDAARAEYQRFLDLWKDADRDLPELAEARSRL